MSRKKKKKKQPRRPRPALAPSRFGEGTAVRVKSGVMDGDYPDIPLGGWSGTVVEVGYGHKGQPLYQVEWNAYTLEHLPAIYRLRCERDGFNLLMSWMHEAELDLDTGEPPHMEQPTELRPQPLDLSVGEDRVRGIFGLTSDDDLPSPDMDALRIYRKYLAEHLHFPFAARTLSGAFSSPEDDFEGEVLGLADAATDTEDEGIMCQARENGEILLLPLATLEAVRHRANEKLLGDYGTWFTGDDDEYQILAQTLDEQLDRPTVARIFQEHLFPARPLPSPAKPLQEENKARANRFLEAAAEFVFFYAVLGLFFGTILAVVPGASIGALVAGVLLALILFLVSRLRQLPAGKSRVTVVAGAILLVGIAGVVGASVVMLVMAYKGSLCGALVGGALGLILRKQWFPLFLLVGAFVGSFGYIYFEEPANAWHGTWVGAVCGAGIGLVLTVIKFLVTRHQITDPART